MNFIAEIPQVMLGEFRQGLVVQLLYKCYEIPQCHSNNIIGREHLEEETDLIWKNMMISYWG